MKNVKEIIAKNLVDLRKSKKYTQQAVAEKLNYSDKAISRWERGESLPDVETLCRICDLYGVTFEYLLQSEQPPRAKNPHVVQDDKAGNIAITLIAACVVWLIATIAYVYTEVLLGVGKWTLFVWAVPVTAVVCSVCNKMWGRKLLGHIISSVINWGMIASIYLELLTYNLWMLFIVGIPIQMIIIISATLKRNRA